MLCTTGVLIIGEELGEAGTSTAAAAVVHQWDDFAHKRTLWLVKSLSGNRLVNKNELIMSYTERKRGGLKSPVDKKRDRIPKVR